MSKYYPSKVKTRTLISREKWFFMLKIRIFNQSESACYRIWPSLCQNYSFSMSGIKTFVFASAGVRILTAGPTMSRFKETCQFNLNPFSMFKIRKFRKFWKFRCSWKLFNTESFSYQLIDCSSQSKLQWFQF